MHTLANIAWYTDMSSVDDNLDFIHVGKRIEQNFLHISFIYIEFRPILCQIRVGNVRKYHILVSRTCRKSCFWCSGVLNTCTNQSG